MKRWVGERAILAIGWLLFLVYSFPGYMSYDSVWQLSQARGLEPVNDWHPPLMTFVWRCLDYFVAGPFLMLVIQSLAFLLGLYVLLKQLMRPRVAAIVAVLVLLVPQNLIVMAVIWKDSQMAGFLIASMAALLVGGRRMRILAVVLLFLATGYRYNAAAATLPILVFLWDRRDDVWWLRRWAIAVGIWLAITLATFVVNGALAEKKAHPWPTASAPVDLVGTIHFGNHLSDEEILRDTEGVPWTWTTKIRIHAHITYKPENSFLDVTQGSQPMMGYITTDADRAAITRAWKNLVFKHPRAFFRHRMAQFKAQLSPQTAVWYGFVNESWAEDWLHYRLQHSKVQLAWAEAMTSITSSGLFLVRLYFWVALILIPLAYRNRAAFVLLTSGLLYELGLFVVAPAIDYRYSHWLVITTIIAVIILIASRARGAIERSA
jgi:hypothetical protein